MGWDASLSSDASPEPGLVLQSPGNGVTASVECAEHVSSAHRPTKGNASAASTCDGQCAACGKSAGRRSPERCLTAANQLKVKTHVCPLCAMRQAANQRQRKNAGRRGVEPTAAFAGLSSKANLPLSASFGPSLCALPSHAIHFLTAGNRTLEAT